MYLKEITATGFKSFADKLNIKLDGKITCIVGPNGSGKSNVVDAVRWVLGEQSVKSLRGEGSMSDVIFSGSKSRSPLNVASVELVFDNSDHFLNVPYTEISIKRRVYRSGENEYFLNGERCRLKDINDLLMDSGMGKESFNIISQGEVDRILSSSSQERRIIFEEASGILKYKKRKEEALRKLDRTHNNIDRANDIILELESQIAPLKEQSEKAKEYLENKQGLDKYEVALLAYDIENYNSELESDKAKKEKLDKEIITISNETSKNDVKYLEDNNKLEKLENEKATLNRELLTTAQEVERINGEKNLLKEKSKTTKEEEEIKEEIRILLENKSLVEGNIEVLKEDIKLLVNDGAKIEERENNEEVDLKKIKQKKVMLTSDYSSHDRDLISIRHKVDSLKTEIEQGGDMPNSVRSVLNATQLNGIYSTIGNILQTNDEYTKALNVAISSNKNFVITKDEESAKKAIAFLKDNHLGRTTFFPLTVIESRYVDQNTLNILKKENEFRGILSDLVTYNPKYKNIIENQLGTVLIVNDIDSATRIAKLIRNRYKIVTLDGDVVNVGGSMSGGSIYKSTSIISLKQDLKNLKAKEELLIKELEEISKESKELDKEIEIKEDKLFQISKEKIALKEKYDTKENELNKLKDKLISMNKEWETLNSINDNSISQKEQELIALYHEKNAKKMQIELRIEALTKETSELKEKIERQQAEEKLKNSNLRALEKEANDLSINISKVDLKLDSMLNTLNEEYELTYEKAKNDYKLDIEPDEARIKVNTYKANIKRIGMVNLDSIEEFDRVNTRYEFLENQKEDLLKAETTLLDIMNEMDGVMEEEFQKTFEQIRFEFQSVFKELFNGGQADLKLTNPENILTTGIEIVASPPGKKLTTISLLSGGEKTLTAISLLFAILNVRTVPFCLFDEVEAALDEANVSQFGKYLDHYKDKTQFLIITHKKKTMEYAKNLYGITMQESGVSKLVSVKLEDREEVL